VSGIYRVENQGVFNQLSVVWTKTAVESDQFSCCCPNIFARLSRGNEKWRLQIKGEQQEGYWVALKPVLGKKAAEEVGVLKVITDQGNTLYFQIESKSFARRMGISLKAYLNGLGSGQDGKTAVPVLSGSAAYQPEQYRGETVPLSSPPSAIDPSQLLQTAFSQSRTDARVWERDDRKEISDACARLLEGSDPATQVKLTNYTLFYDRENRQIAICERKWIGSHSDRTELGKGSFAKGLPAVLVRQAGAGFLVENAAIKKSYSNYENGITNEEAIRTLEREYEVRKGLGAIPGLIDFRGFIKYRNRDDTDKAILIMPRYDGDIFDHPVKNRRDQIRLFKTLLTALAKLEEKEILHLDIKRENILVRGRPGSQEFCLIDFGIMGRIGSPWMPGENGPVGMFPPETKSKVLKGQQGPVEGAHSWMAGCLMGEIIQGRNFTDPNPFARTTPPAQLLDDSLVSRLHPEFPKLLRDMVHEDPKKRIRVAQALKRLEEIEKSIG